jgi:allophanate hydrolase subunit 1
MDILGLEKLPAEAQPIIKQLLDRVDALEAQSAKDISAIADKVIAGLGPKVDEVVTAVNTITLTVNASVVEITALARRIDGAKLKFELGPEIPDDPNPSVTVTA